MLLVEKTAGGIPSLEPCTPGPRTRSRRPQRPHAISPFFQHLIFDSCNPSRVFWASQVDMTCKFVGICRTLMSFSCIDNGRNSYFWVPIVSKNRLFCFLRFLFICKSLPTCRVPLTSQQERVRSHLRGSSQRSIKSVLEVTCEGVHSVAWRAC